MVKNTYKIYYSVKNIFTSNCSRITSFAPPPNFSQMSISLECSNFNCKAEKEYPDDTIPIKFIFPKKFLLCGDCVSLTHSRYYCCGCSGVTSPHLIPSSSRMQEIPNSEGREGYILEDDKMGSIPIIPGKMTQDNRLTYLYCKYCVHVN